MSATPPSDDIRRKAGQDLARAEDGHHLAGKDTSGIMIGRHALVIAATDYPGAELNNAVSDGGRVADALCARGFSVSIFLNPEMAAIEAALTAFTSVAQAAELAVIYLAGHAVERHGSGYFLPVDFSFPPTPGGLRHMAIGLSTFVEATTGAASRIVVLDACRNWPHDPDEARRTSNDLQELVANEREWPDLLLAYSTSATMTASDGVKGAASAFSESLCRHLLDHSLTVDECFRRVSQDVVAQRSRQQPWTYSSLAHTLSFTDLPRFAAVQRHAVPNPQHLSGGTWTTTDAQRRAVIVGVGDAMAWSVGIGGFKQVRHPGEDRLMGAADCGKLLFLAGSNGALYLAGAGRKPVIDLDVPHSFGLKASPEANSFVLYGAGTVGCFEVNAKTTKEIARHDVDFDVYCCTYMPDGLIWVAGAQGSICEIDPRDPDASIREIARVKHHVNAMAVAPAGDRVFVVGQGGLAVELDRFGQEIKELLPDRQFKTAAGIRAQLVDLADDELIRRFVFERSKLDERLREDLAEHLGIPDYPACDLAPTLPILAVATEESSVVLLDTRDCQVIEELDVGSGNSATVSGVQFLSDHQLVVVDGRGAVTFFGA